ncbi:MAG: hypothetical protein DHS20C18_09580 [Saprospiraceae bacterium]|nr:MAG: hypothetical protein DHS20C18_09580 [Saprospiraceae bacterium]
MPRKTEHKQGLSREEFVKASHNGTKTNSSADKITHQALRGMQYLDTENGVEQLLTRLDHKIDSQSVKNRNIYSIWRSPALKVAAAAVLLLLPAYYLLQPNFHPSNYSTAYFEHLPSAIPNTGTKKGGENIQTEKVLALEAYNNKDYQTAIPSLKRYLDQNPKDQEVRFYYGIALLGQEKHKAAKDAFSQVVTRPPSADYLENAKWYLALTLLDLKEMDQARHLLMTIQQEKGAYTNKAEKLLKAIK